MSQVAACFLQLPTPRYRPAAPTWLRGGDPTTSPSLRRSEPGLAASLHGLSPRGPGGFFHTGRSHGLRGRSRGRGASALARTSGNPGQTRVRGVRPRPRAAAGLARACGREGSKGPRGAASGMKTPPQGPRPQPRARRGRGKDTEADSGRAPSPRRPGAPAGPSLGRGQREERRGD